MTTRKLFGPTTRRLISRFCAGGRHRKVGRRYAVAIIKMDRLGDFVLAVSAIRRLIERYGESECLLVVSPLTSALAKREFPCVEILVLPWGLSHIRTLGATMRYRRMVSRLRVDTVVCLRHQRWDYEEIVISWFAAERSIRVLDEFSRKADPDLRFFDFNG